MGCLVIKACSYAYGYTPLANNWTIRVLTLYSGNLEDPLRGELELVAVDDAGAYEPLSDVWGDDRLSHEIFLPSARLRLMSSLHQALRRLRLQAGPTRAGRPDLH